VSAPPSLSAQYDQLLDELRSHRDTLQKAITFLIAVRAELVRMEAVPDVSTPPASEPRRGALLKDPPPPARRKIDPEKLRELHAQGLNDRQISEHFGCTAVSVLHRRQQLGLPSQKEIAGKLPKDDDPAGVERVTSPAAVFTWLKLNGTHIAVVEPGALWRINARDVVDVRGLLKTANRKREFAGLRHFKIVNATEPGT
jgi:hypothetical protein